MDIQRLLEQVDLLYDQNKGPEAEVLMRSGIATAQEECDYGGQLQLLNELLGYYRETSQVENSYEIAMQAMFLAENMGLAGSIPYATTLLNVANAYRAGGRLGEALELYTQVQEIYEKSIPENNMLFASFYNNLSLLYQEMGNFRSAKESLLKALDIVKEKQADFEIAVTYTNLSSTSLQLGEREEAYKYGALAVSLFETMKVEDTHYCAALAALGTYYYESKDYGKALEIFGKAIMLMEQNPARTQYYHRLKERYLACKSVMSPSGLELCRDYYETYGKPMIEKQFPEYRDKIAVGLVGEGSDCFGFDDEWSRDHDYGPGFCMWVTDETYEKIGQQLKQAYDALPKEHMGCVRKESVQGKDRRGLWRISDFYRSFLIFVEESKENSDEDSNGNAKENLKEALLTLLDKIDYTRVEDSALAAVVNGEIYVDEEGIFSAVRHKLQQGFPPAMQYWKLAQSVARFSQYGQYNYQRMKKRGDKLTASMMLIEGMKEAMKLQHYLEGKYPPHDKWLRLSCKASEGGKALVDLFEQLYQEESLDKCLTEGQRIEEIVEQAGDLLAGELYAKGFVSNRDSYLDAHVGELTFKASVASDSIETLCKKITKLEFEAFDKVRNEGGRASCQNDWPTFYIMRMSQYLTWNVGMLLQYFYDFTKAYQQGRNLIEEKYGRMMEYTAPLEYQKIKEHFPPISPEKKMIIQQIADIQVGWMEEFSQRYPHLGNQARNIHSREDDTYDTSFETYLIGELSTYSDKMLELYGRHVAEYARSQKNLTLDTMKNTVCMYGYKDLDTAEEEALAAG